MLSMILLTIIALLSGILIISALVRTIKVYYVYTKFKKTAKGIPMLPFNWSPGGNTHEILFKPNAALRLEPIYRKLGIKNFGAMFGMQPVVLTCDLELMRTMNLIEPNQHFNRFDNIGLPIDEIEFDSLMNARGDQWRRIRKAIAPMYT